VMLAIGRAILMLTNACTKIVVPEASKRQRVVFSVEVGAVHGVITLADAVPVVKEESGIAYLWGASAVLVDVVPVHVGSAFHWPWDAGASWQVPEVIFRADDWLADATALSGVFWGDMPNETTWAGLWNAHALLVFVTPSKAGSTLRWDGNTSAQIRAPVLTRRACLRVTLACARLRVEEVSVGGVVEQRAIFNEASAFAMVLTPVETGWAFLWSADASASVDIPVLRGAAGLRDASAEAVHVIPDLEFVGALLWGAVALASFVVQIERLAIYIWAVTVEAFALAIVGAPVEAWWAASVCAQAQAFLVVPVLTKWALTGLAMARAGVGVEVLVIGALKLSTDARAGVEAPD